MANTYTALYYHLVFSTKNRAPWIDREFEERIWKYLGGIAREHKMIALQVGGLEDHIHMAIQAPPTLAPAKIAQLVKGASSSWIHDTFPALADFSWQDGYGGIDRTRFPRMPITERRTSHSGVAPRRGHARPGFPWAEAHG